MRERGIARYTHCAQAHALVTPQLLTPTTPCLHGLQVTNHLLRAGQGANDLGSGDDDDSDSSEESPYYSGDAH